MVGPGTSTKQRRVDTLPIVPDSYSELVGLVRNLQLHTRGLGVGDGVRKRLSADPIDVVRNREGQSHWRSIRYRSETDRLIREQLMRVCVEGAGNITVDPARAQIAHPITCLIEQVIGLVESDLHLSAHGIRSTQPSSKPLEEQNETLRTLQQRIVQLTRDALTLFESLPHSHLHLSG